MKKLQSVLLIAAFISVISIAPAFADPVTIDFEGLADGFEIGGYYSGMGVSFTGAIILTTPPLDTISYPTHSGSGVMSAVYSNGDVGSITATFTSPVNYVSLYYTTATSLWLEAYDSVGNPISFDEDLSGGSGNISGSDLLQVSGNNIAYVVIHDGGGFYTVDDFSFSVPVPEPGILTLLGLALISLVGFRKKFNE